MKSNYNVKKRTQNPFLYHNAVLPATVDPPQKGEENGNKRMKSYWNWCVFGGCGGVGCVWVEQTFIIQSIAFRGTLNGQKLPQSAKTPAFDIKPEPGI